MAERGVLQRIATAPAMTWLLAGVAGWAVLAWAAALAGMGGRIAAVIPAIAPPLPQPLPRTPDRIGPLAQYREAASRPLFTQDRRPRNFIATAPEQGAGLVQAQTLDFILTGVLISPQVQLAMLQPSGGGEAQRVPVGSSPEGASGWRLVALEARRAVFEGMGGQSTLELRTFGDAASPPPPAGSAVATVPAPTPTTTTTAVAPRTETLANAGAAEQPDQARIEEIRRRIEARRAQLRAGGQNTGSAPSSAPPTQ